MALGPRLDLRQTQSLVMTPQLQQAIKLLALSNLEIESFVAEALESNPLLDVGDVQREAGEEPPADGGEHDAAPGPDGETALDIAQHALDPEAAPGDAGDWSRAADGGYGEELPDIENRLGYGPSLAENLG